MQGQGQQQDEPYGIGRGVEGSIGQGGVFPGYAPNHNAYPQGHSQLYDPHQQQQLQYQQPQQVYQAQPQYNYSSQVQHQNNPYQQQNNPHQQQQFNPQGYAPQPYVMQQQAYGVQQGQQQQTTNMIPQQQQQPTNMMTSTQQPTQQSYVHSSPSTSAYSLPTMTIYNSNAASANQPPVPYYNGQVQSHPQSHLSQSMPSPVPPQPISVPVPSPRMAGVAVAPQRAAAMATGRPLRPPYTDPVSQIVYTVDNPEYEGFLTKQSSWLKEWRRRYFILQGSKLFFCKNAVSGPHGMMDLATCTTVKSADLKSGKRHSFEISTTETCYLLYADTESEKDDWIGRVGKAIVCCSRTYYKGDGNSGSGGGEANNGGTNGTYANQYNAENDDDDIYENDDPDNPYFND